MREKDLGTIVIGKGRSEIGGVENGELLPELDALAELGSELHDPPRQRRDDLDEAGWIGFDDARK